MHTTRTSPTAATPTATPAVTPGSTGSRSAHWMHPRLDDEWRRLAHRPAAVATARAWRVTPASFDDLDELLVLAGFKVVGDPATEAVLRGLVRVAAHDELAARVVLQRIVPGLLARVRRHAASHRDVFEELVSGAWVTIREFDQRRRPSCIAAALISGAEYRAFGRADRRPHQPESSTDPIELDEVVDDPSGSSSQELAELVHAARLDGVSDDELAIVRQIVAASGPQPLAAALGVTVRTVRNRRDKVTERLRRVALAA